MVGVALCFRGAQEEIFVVGAKGEGFFESRGGEWFVAQLLAIGGQFVDGAGEEEFVGEGGLFQVARGLQALGFVVLLLEGWGLRGGGNGEEAGYEDSLRGLCYLAHCYVEYIDLASIRRLCGAA